MAGDDYFKTSSITTNIELDVSKDYKSTQIFDAHSFDVEKPEILERNIDSGKIRKINKIK